MSYWTEWYIADEADVSKIIANDHMPGTETAMQYAVDEILCRAHCQRLIEAQ